MPVTRIKNNQVTDASGANTQLGINANTKLQNYSITSTKIANNLVYGSDLTVTGNLTVQGNSTAIDTTITTIEDPIIVLASTQTSGAPAVDIGYLGFRGNESNIAFVWDESAGQFVTAFTSTGESNTTITITSYANLQIGNLSLTGNILNSTLNVSGNITGGNLLTPGLISATSTITSAANITGGNILTGGLISATGTITSAANVTGANIITAGLITATGNITGGNLLTGGSGGAISGSGNITGGNILTGGLISAAGNITSGSGSFFIGNGSQLTGVIASSAGFPVSNGTSNINAAVNANITVGVAGTSNVAVFASTGVFVTGVNSVTGNITGGNILTPGLISAAGLATSGNVETAGYVSATGNVTGGNVVTARLASSAGLTIATTASNGNITIQPNGSGNIILGGNTYINGVSLQPFQDNDVASKYYVDIQVSTGLTVHEAVVAATTSNLATATGGTITYTQPNGASNGVGALLTTTGSFNLIDTANVQTLGTRILVKNEGNAVFNGVYTWANATNLVRSTDADEFGTDSANALSLNSYFFVTGGNINLGSAYVVDEPSGPITFGTSNIQFAQFSQAQIYSANTAAGLILVGQTFSAKVDNNTTAFDGGGNISVKAGANLTTPNIGAATGTSLSATGNIASGGNLVVAGFVTATGNVTGGNILTAGLISATSTITSAANITGGNILYGSGIVSGTGNVYAANFIGNISGNIDAAGSNTQVQFNDGDLLGASAAFTFNKATNVLAVGGQITSTGTGNAATGGGQIFLNGTGNNRIDWANVGTGAPAFTTRSTGTKVVLFPALSGSTTDYALGIDAATMWSSIPEATAGFYFKWYGATTEVANLSGTGIFSAVGNVNSGGNILATGNVTGANLILTSGIIDGPASGRITINGSDIDTDFAVDGDTLANVFYVDAGTGTASFGASTQVTNAIVNFATTTSIKTPVGNTAQRPGTGVTGMLRFNTTNNALEIYDNSEWSSVGTPVFTVIDDEQFAGDGSTVAFTLGSTQTTNSCIVSINGVVQIPTLAYSVSGTDPTCVLTFTEAPAAGDVIDVRQITTTTSVTSIANSSGNAVIAVSATAAQTNVTGDLSVSGTILGGNINSTAITNGNSNVSVVSSGGNVTVGIGGTGNVAVFSTGGMTVGVGNVAVGNLVNNNSNGVGNIGTTTTRFNQVFALASSAQYADLAEKYTADATYETGTVVAFGGTQEVTISATDRDRRVAGVISALPSFRMNDALESEYTAMVALTGRVPTKVTGTVRKGDMMVSAGNGVARAEANPQIGTVIGKALEDFDGAEGTIEVVVGRV